MGLLALQTTYKKYIVEKDDFYFRFTYNDLVSSVRTITESFDHVFETIDDLIKFLLLKGFTQKLHIVNADLSESREIIINHSYYEFESPNEFKIFSCKFSKKIKIIIGLDGYRYYDLKTKFSAKMTASEIMNLLF